VLEVITIETPSLGDRSYVVHDGRRAVVVDPVRDIDRIEAVLDEHGLTAELVLETHVHNDYITGGLTLSRTTGAAYVHAAAETVHVDHRGVADGDRLEVGSLTVDVVATPGHTEHHLSYVVRADGATPAVFTGGSLLYGTVGRTDLVAADVTDRLTREQHRSARRLAGLLPDDAQVYPTHGFGSFCASAQSDEDSDGTLGTERRVNLALTIDDEDAFVERLVAGLTAYPAYYAHMAPVNRAGPSVPDLSAPAEVDPVELARRIHRGEWVVDLRQRRAFATDHLAGTIGIELEDGFATYLGWLIPWGTPLTLVGDSQEQIHDAQRQLVRIGIDRPAGAHHGGIDEYGRAAERRSYRVVTFADLQRRLREDAVQVLDVRRADEHADGHIPGAVNVPIHELLARREDVPAGEVWVHCASGFRASIAASLLDRAGHDVVLIDDDVENAASLIEPEPSS
jgi:glyoxylase-like metal-dependent hydrolase (beta-lactamase superfamily II)/rhodanese-related sulfurtransferase